MSRVTRFFTWVLVTFSMLLTLEASEPQAELKTDPETLALKEGEVVSIYIRIWPLENAEVGEFAKIEGTSLLGMLSILKVQSLAVSENNADVVELRALAAVTRVKHQSDYALFYRGTAIPLSAGGLKIAETLNAPADYFVLDQKLLTSKLALFITLAGVLSAALGLFFMRHRLAAKIRSWQKDPVREQKKYYQLLFSRAESREDFERIYAARKQWQALLVSSGLGFEEFYKVMEKHQYKKEWYEPELLEVKSHFEAIRGSFNER